MFDEFNFTSNHNESLDVPFITVHSSQLLRFEHLPIPSVLSKI
jgi:hypothetical protein